MRHFRIFSNQLSRKMHIVAYNQGVITSLAFTNRKEGSLLKKLKKKSERLSKKSWLIKMKRIRDEVAFFKYNPFSSLHERWRAEAHNPDDWFRSNPGKKPKFLVF